MMRRLGVLCGMVLVLSMLWGTALAAEAVYAPEFTTVPLSTGISMRYAALGEEGAVPVILLHGATDSYFSYAQVAPCLAQAGYRVYVPELRGHGGTDKPEEGPYTLEMHVKDVAALLDVLAVELPFVVGHSLGSFIAQSLVAEHGAEMGVRGLVLIGTAASTKGNPTLTWALNGDEAFPGIGAFLNGVPEAFIEEWVETDNADTAFGEHIREHALSLPPHSWVHTFFGLEEVDNTPALERITAPVLILWGTEDTFFTQTDQEHVEAALWKSPKVECITLEGASHNTHWDEGQLGPVTDAMLAFFQENS